MPSTATITSTQFYTFVALTKIQSAQVNSNFSVFRGHILPVEPLTSTASDLNYDLGSAEYHWRGVYQKFGVMFQCADTTTSLPANPSAGYMDLYFKDDTLLYTKSPAGAETLISPKEFSAAINNNQTAQNVTGMLFSGVKAEHVSYVVKRIATSTVIESGLLVITYNGTTWTVEKAWSYSDAGIDFAISAGQVTYTSDNMAGSYDATNSKIWWKHQSLVGA